MALAAAPGNVRLRAGEAGLPKASVVNVSQLRTIDRARIKRRSGQLSRERLSLVWSGIRLVLEPSTGLGTGGYSD
jgi:mRNA interferase MazF